MAMVLPNHNVGRVFLEGEGEGPELKGSVTAILRFRSSVPKGLREVPLAH